MVIWLQRKTDWSVWVISACYLQWGHRRVWNNLQDWNRFQWSAIDRVEQWSQQPCDFKATSLLQVRKFYLTFLYYILYCCFTLPYFTWHFTLLGSFLLYMTWLYFILHFTLHKWSVFSSASLKINDYSSTLLWSFLPHIFAIKRNSFPCICCITWCTWG